MYSIGMNNQEYEDGYFEWGDGPFSKALRKGEVTFVRSSDGKRIPVERK